MRNRWASCAGAPAAAGRHELAGREALRLAAPPAEERNRRDAGALRLPQGLDDVGRVSARGDRDDQVARPREARDLPGEHLLVSRSRCRCRRGASRPRRGPRPGASRLSRRSGPPARSQSAPPRRRCRRCRRCRSLPPPRERPDDQLRRGVDRRPDAGKRLERAEGVGQRLLKRHGAIKVVCGLARDCIFLRFGAIPASRPQHSRPPMLLRKLTLSHFRNVPHAALGFEGRRQFFAGPNGQGKSNLLEAAGFLTALRSFRAPDGRHLIMHGRPRGGDRVRGGARRLGARAGDHQDPARRQGALVRREPGDAPRRPRRALPDGGLLLARPAADTGRAGAQAPLARPDARGHGRRLPYGPADLQPGACGKEQPAEEGRRASGS